MKYFDRGSFIQKMKKLSIPESGDIELDLGIEFQGQEAPIFFTLEINIIKKTTKFLYELSERARNTTKRVFFGNLFLVIYFEVVIF